MKAMPRIHRLQAELPAVQRTVSCCRVCGSREVRTDEVVLRGWVLLAECSHCDHRWTRRLPDQVAPARAAASAQRAVAAVAGPDAEVASAA